MLWQGLPRGNFEGDFAVKNGRKFKSEERKFESEEQTLSIRGYNSSSPSQPLCLIPEKLQLTPECTFGSVEGIISLIEAKPELIFNFSD